MTGCLDERVLRALRMADMQLSAWENGYAFDTHGPSREAQRLVTEALAALSASRQEGWISVDARLPSHEQEVICTGFEGNDPAKKRWQEFATFHECGLFYDTVLGEQLYPPTHWQPTPAAPQQSQEAQGDSK